MLDTIVPQLASLKEILLVTCVHEDITVQQALLPQHPVQLAPTDLSLERMTQQIARLVL